MRIVCRQTILKKFHTLFFLNLQTMSQNLSSAAVVFGHLKANNILSVLIRIQTVWHSDGSSEVIFFWKSQFSEKIQPTTKKACNSLLRMKR